MYQQELKFFWPLTEQVNLDLDFKPCQDYEEQKRKEMIASSVTITAGTGLTFAANTTGVVTWAAVNPNYQEFQVLPDGAVGSWQVTPNMTIGRKTKPKLLHRIFTKYILGWEWKDK